ncbi:MAG: hypothetical protein NZ930_08535, partial [Candidatus Bipolaricaulota bacterium]|nr:hypothetical protein [Candidatus Bipolaricaulota bacterium]
MEAYRAAEKALEKKRQQLRDAWGIEPVPDEPLPIGGRDRYDTCRLPLYGLKQWGELFNARQKLALLTFADAVRRAHAAMLRAGYEPEFAKPVAVYLGLRLDLLATYLNTLVRWRSDVTSFERSFDRQALPMVWDYGELNPQGGARGEWELEGLLEVLSHVRRSSACAGTTIHDTATSLPWPDDYFDAVL